jgi:vacuolar-type H+-ATPase subunit I/STV1
MRLFELVTCPKCGTTVETPTKTWQLPRRTTKLGEESKMTIGMFECPNCKARFRASVEKPSERASIKSMVEKIKGIEGEFVNTLKNLREKLQKLETERSSLLLEIDELKKAAESKASAIENEITMLRDEVKSLKELLGYSESENE